MWVKLIVPEGQSTLDGYQRLEGIGNLTVADVNGSYYIRGTLPSASAYGNLTQVYLDPAYSAQADAQAALDQLVNTGGVLVP